MRFPFLFATVFGVAGFWPLTSATATDAPAKQAPLATVPARIQDMSFIAGRWGREDAKNRLEELWSEPDGDSMVGMFRWIKEGKVWIYEILTIREEGGTLVFRFRHFGNDLTAWEPEKEPLTYRLSLLRADEAVFENPASESHRLFSFQRQGDKLTVRVGAFRNGRIATSDFEYERK